MQIEVAVFIASRCPEGLLDNWRNSDCEQTRSGEAESVEAIITGASSGKARRLRVRHRATLTISCGLAFRALPLAERIRKASLNGAPPMACCRRS